MKRTKLNLLTMLLLLIVVGLGQNAWATTKTVTYTLNRYSENLTDYLQLIHSGDTPFNGTTTVQVQQMTNRTSATFNLPDGFMFTFTWGSGQIVHVSSSGSNGYYYCGDANVRFELLWNFSNRYVTNFKVTDQNGTPSTLYQNGTANTDYNNSEQGETHYMLAKNAPFAKITITYADAPTLSIFEADGENAYKIQDKDDLRHLANYVNKGHNSGSGVTFRQTQNITCDNTYTPIGTSSYPFGDTYDGQEYTINDITVSKNANNIGFFGYIDGGTVKDLTIINSIFTGIDNVGAIAGTNHNGTIQNCVVGNGTSDVKIQFVTNTISNHGGIVGSNSGANASILGCKCRAQVIGTDCPSASNYGGIAGYNEGTIQDCLHMGNQVNGNNCNGTLVGQNAGTLTNNYYTYNGMPGGVGINGQSGSNDCDGARRARTVTMGENVQLNGAETATYSLSGITAIGTGSYAMRYNNLLYSGATQNIAFSYNASPALGYVLSGFNATNGGTFSGNILTMPNADVNVTAAFTDVWGVSNNPAADGTEAHPYIISDTTGLNLLARNVNGTHGYTANNFSGKYFKLNNNISYSTAGSIYESNYTAIGRSSTSSFCGVFDGGGNTIYNIRICGNDDYQGLFGWIDSYPNNPGTVKDVRVKQANITGGQNVGEIVGYLNGDIENCLALSSSINGTGKVGAIVGYKATSGHTCFGNYYVGCTVSGTSGATNVGVGSEPGYGNNTPHDIAGVRSVHLIILNMLEGEDFSASGTETVVIEGATYYASTSTITLTYNADMPEGFELRYYYNDGNEDHLVTSNDAYSFTMPAATVYVFTNFIPIVYTISYDLAGGALPSGQSNPATYTVTQPSFTLVNPVRTGCLFAGWTGTGLTEPTQTVTIAGYSTGDRSYTATWTDLWGIEDGANGSEEHPYIITTTAGLDLLAKMANGTDGYTIDNFHNKYFKLGADIDYSTKPLDANGENYTTIGGYPNGQYRYFLGTFDGDGHTVSGIRINKEGSSDADSYLGLFGTLRGTLKNVNLSNAHITGYAYVGGLVGYIEGGTVMNCVTGGVTLNASQAGAYNFGGIAGRNTGIMQNCIVVGATIPALHYTGSNEDHDASGTIVGFNNWNAHVSFNYYSGVTIGGATTGIGVSGNDGNDDRHDITADNGAVPAYALSLGQHIFATPTPAITHNNSDYYVVGTTVTLNADGYTMSGGFTVKDAQNNDVPLSGGNTFVMPASDVTVSANLTLIDWSGSGTQGDPYIIMYRSQLDLLAERVNGGNEYDQTYFKLGADIDYPHTTAWNDATSTENNFTVIGDVYHEIYGYWNTHIFNGVFDGDGHTISGIRIYRNGGTDADENQGLFGNVGLNGIVKNVTLTDVRITAASYAGGISGNISMGTIENCHITGTVAIHAVVNCYSHGGIVGFNENGTVRGCTSAATLSKAADLLYCGEYGGIVGNNQGNNATVEDCLAVGVTVNANYNAGAIFGYTETNYYDYHHGNNYYYGCNANGNTSNIGYGGGDIGNHDGAAPCYKLTLPTGVAAIDGCEQELINYQGNLYVTVGQTVFLYPVYEGYIIGGVSYNDGENHTITPNAMGYYAFEVTTAHDITVSVIWNDIPNWSGHGEEDNPYLITNCAELNALAIMVNSGNDYENQYFKLANDINYPHTTAWNDVTSTENNFTTIGGYDRGFKGTFDGDGHTVSGIRIYKEGSSDADSYLGLFGTVNNGRVENLTVSDTRITGYRYVGGIAGIVSKPDDGSDHRYIANCHVTSSVAIHAVANKTRYHGGVVGYVGYVDCSYCTSSATLTIADGVTECQYFGGIAGYSYYNTYDCLAVDVTMSAGIQNSGAIVGGWEGGLRHNFYYNCHRSNNFSNIGTGTGDKNTNNTYGAYPANAFSVTIPGYGDGNGGWAFIASPMDYLQTPHHVQNLIATPAAHYDLYCFDQAVAGAEWQNYKAHAGIDSNDTIDFRIENGQGYLYANKEDVTLTFLGKPNVETVSEIDLSYTEGKPLAGYNLVGNPFTVAAYADRPYYKMNAAGTDVEVVESYWTNSIPACTGVVVVATGANQSVTFSTTAPEAPAASTGDNGSIQMTLTKANERGDAFQDKAIVSFNEGSELGKFYFGEQDANIYIPKDGNDYAIVSAEAHGEIPVNFKAKENGEYTLTFSVRSSHLSVLRFIDNLTGANVDLLVEPSYTFEAKTTDYASRFKLVFANENENQNENQNENDNDNENDNFAFLDASGNLIVNGTGTIQVVDILGRVLFSKELSIFNSQLSIFNSPGVYVLRLINGENNKTQKIIIK